MMESVVPIGLALDRQADPLSRQQPGGVLARRMFDGTDQARFAYLSGDTNPIHMDASAARRAGFGEPIVHGVHIVLWALEALLREKNLALSRLRATFLAPVHVGETAIATLKRRSGSTFRLDITVGDTLAAVLMLNLPGERGAAPRPGNRVHSHDWPKRPLELRFDELKDHAGAIRFAHRAECAASAFPIVSRSIAPKRVATMFALSRLVGMICPGLHSILKSYTLDFGETGEGGMLRYATLDVSERFRVVRLAVSGPGTIGEVAAVVRATPMA
jgi:acyl dehydratase